MADDRLYEGVEVADGFILKAHAKVPVRRMAAPAGQSIVDALVKRWQEHLDGILEDAEAVLRRGGVSKALFVLDGGLQKGGSRSLDDLFKAKVAPDPKSAPPATNLSGQVRAKAGEGQNRQYQRPQGGVAAPGSRGGKFYIDQHGKVRYGTRPNADTGDREATPEEVTKHYKMFKPSPFISSKDRDIVSAMKELKQEGDDGVSMVDHQFITWWYGDPETPDAQSGLDAFLETYGLSEKDLTTEGKFGGDLSAIKFPNGMSYEQAVHDFFLSQDFNDPDASPDDEGYVTPEMVDEVLQDIFERFNAGLADPAVQKLAAKKAQQTEEKLYSYFQKAEATSSHYDRVPAIVVGNADPSDVVNNALIAMSSLDLLFKPKTGEVGAGAGDLKGLITPVSSFLDEPAGKKRAKDGGYLYMHRDKLATMTAGQLMAVHMASSLNTMFDGRSYNDAFADEGDLPKYPPTMLKQEVERLLAKKLNVSREMMDNVVQSCDWAVHLVAAELNQSNTGQGGIARRVLDLPSSAIGDKMHIDKIVEEEEKFRELRVSAIEAQKNGEFGDIPPSMDGGRWDGKHLNEVTGEPWKPFAHQAQAVNWMEVVKRGILALDAGMGKTPTVIAFMEKLKTKKPGQKAILFLPPSLMGQWPDEIASFAPGAKDKILNLAGLSLEERKIALQSDLAKKAEYILISTGTLSDPKDTQKAGHDITNAAGGTDHDPEAVNDGTGGMDNELIKALQGIDAAVFVDEVHQGGYKTEGGVRQKLLKQVLEGREHAFGMTATPMPNHPLDLFTLTDTFHPNSVGERAEWEGALHGVQFNKDLQQWEVTNPQNIVNLNTRIKPFVFSKLITDPEVEADMGKQLPPLRSDAVDLEPSTVKDPKTGLSQWDFLRDGGACDFMADKRIEQLQKERLARGQDPLSEFVAAGLAKVLRIGLKRQAAISPALIHDGWSGESPKITEMANSIMSHFSSCKWQPGKEGHQQPNDAPVVVFTSFPEKAFPHLKKKLIESGLDPSIIGEIYGAKSPAERAFAQDMTNQGKFRVLLVGTQAGGAGLNLQKKANRVLHLDDPWNPALKRQSSGRVWRTGQKDWVHQSTFRIKGSIDMDVEEKIAGKQTMTSALLGDPDPEAFTNKSAEQISALSGRVISDTLKTEQLSQLLDSLGDIPLDMGSLGFGEGEDGEDDGGPMESLSAEDLDKLVSHGPEVDTMAAGANTEAHKKANAALRENAPYLADKIDRGAEWTAWVQERREKELAQRHEIKNRVADVYEAAGKKKEAQEARTQAANIEKMAAQWHGEHKAKAEEHTKAGRADDAKRSLDRMTAIEKVFPHLKEQASAEGGVAEGAKPQGAKSKGAVSEGAKPEGQRATGGSKAGGEAAGGGAKAGGKENVIGKPEKAAKTKAPEAEWSPDAGESKKKEKAAKEPKSEALTHKAGVKLNVAKLPIGKSGTKTFGGDDGELMSQAAAHYLFDELRSNKDKSLEEYAERVVKPIWPGKWSRKAGVGFVNDVLDEFRKLKAVG